MEVCAVSAVTLSRVARLKYAIAGQMMYLISADNIVIAVQGILVPRKYGRTFDSKVHNCSILHSNMTNVKTPRTVASFSHSGKGIAVPHFSLHLWRHSSRVRT